MNIKTRRIAGLIIIGCFIVFLIPAANLYAKNPTSKILKIKPVPDISADIQPETTNTTSSTNAKIVRKGQKNTKTKRKWVKFDGEGVISNIFSDRIVIEDSEFYFAGGMSYHSTNPDQTPYAGLFKPGVYVGYVLDNAGKIKQLWLEDLSTLSDSE